MKGLNKTLLSLSLSISVAVGASTFAIAGTDAATVSVAGATITAVDNSESAVMVLKIGGGSLQAPIEYRSASGTASLNVGGLADGDYNYEVVVASPGASEGAEGTLQTQTGSFSVSNGSVVEDVPAFAPTNGTDPAIGQPVSSNQSFFSKLAVAVLDFVVPSAEAADLVTDNVNFPRVHFRDNGANRFAFIGQGTLTGNDLDALSLFSYVGNNYVLNIQTGSNFKLAMSADNFMIRDVSGGASADSGVGYFNIHRLATNSYFANSNGDIALANNSVFVDASTDSVGLGTTSPAVELHILDGTPRFRLDTGAQTFQHGVNDDYAFDFYDGTTNHRVMTVENSTGVCGENGQIAPPCIGYFEEDNGDAPIHYKRSDGEMQVRIQETGSGASPATKNRTLLRMINNGGPNFSFQDTSNGIGWQFAQTTAGDMAISKEFSGGSEFIVQGDGRVRMGPGPVTNFDLRNNGDLLIPNGVVKVGGTTLNVPDYVFEEDYKLMPLDELQVFIKKEKHLPNVPSEADIKKAKLLDLGGTQMTLLEKVEELTLYTLQQHEQIKGLQSDNKSLNDKLSDQTMALQTENAELKDRLASLEKLVTNIASSGNTMNATGKKVALNVK